LLHYETGAPPNYLTLCKINGGRVGEKSWAEQSSVIVTQAGSIRFAVSFSIFNHNASNATGVENRGQISYI